MNTRKMADSYPVQTKHIHTNIKTTNSYKVWTGFSSLAVGGGGGREGGGGGRGGGVAATTTTTATTKYKLS